MGIHRACTIEIPVGMIGEIHQRGGIRGSLHLQRQASTFYGINSAHRDGAGVIFLTIGRYEGKHEARIRGLLNRPGHIGKALQATMQVVRAIVHCQVVFLAIQHEGTAGNAVGHTPADTTAIAGIRGQVLQRLGAEQAVCTLVFEAQHAGTEIGNQHADFRCFKCI